MDISSQAQLVENNGIGIYQGFANQLGAHVIKEQGTNFAIYAPNAKSVQLCLFDENEALTHTIDMPAKTGRIWHVYLAGILAGQWYAYRVDGDFNPDQGLFHDPQKLLIDPYAKGLNRPVVWNEKQYQGDSQKMIPKCIVQTPEFDWQQVSKPNIPDSDTVLYELHVKGFTRQHPDVPENLRGTYLGLIEPCVIEYLKTLGITSLQLMPVSAFMSEPRLEKMGLTNYWGYNPINFFTPDPRYAQNDSMTEFKTMVRELHRHGFEVILDVVFNHSAESDFEGPILSFRGFDNRNFYMFETNEQGLDYTQYVNNTGCGNSINLDNPYVLQLVTESLRYWVEDMHVDGFRFDLAVSLAREGHDFDNYSAFFKVLFQDPVLSQVKLIAEPWDIGWGGYRLGQFPENWHECNDKYRDTCRAFWRGETGVLPDFATRLMGSRDVFHKGLRSINTSVNYIAYHDGFTLNDMVCYKDKHNQANGEDNRDGHGHNLSDNYGVEGPTTDKKIIDLRNKQKRNLFATLFLSQGTPHFLAGDEISRTQLGNNNAYCQDNSINWMNWDIASEDQELLKFVSQLIKLRHSSQLLHSLSLQDDTYFKSVNTHKVNWFKYDGEMMDHHAWHDPHFKAFMFELVCAENEHCSSNDRFLIIINASEENIHFTLPKLPTEQSWLQHFDTSDNYGSGRKDKILESKCMQESRSVSLICRSFKSN